MTRKMTIAILVLALCAILLPSTLIAKDQVERPHKTQGHFTGRVNLSDWSLVSESWGQSTHLGRETMEASGQLTPGGALVWAAGIVTAANGDQLFWYSEVIDVVIFIGGTGRFEGATGVMTMVTGPQEITFEDGTMIVKYTFTMTGTITY